MRTAAVLNILVTADTKQATANLARMDSQLRGTGSRAAAAGQAVRKGLSYAALGAAGVTAASVKMAADFDKSMRNVNSIAGLPEASFKKLEDQVLELAGPTAQAPKTLADGLYDLVSSGFDAKESMTILKASAKAATAGLTDTATSTKAVAAVLNAYRRPAKDAKAVSDDLFQTVNLGVISFEDLAQNIGDVLPFAAGLGVDLKQVGAAISTMTKEGLSGAEATTRLKNVLVAFTKPSEALTATLRQMGYESGQQIINQKGLQGALVAVTKEVGGNQEAVAKLFPNIRALGGALALTGGNARNARKDLAGFRDDAGATNRVFAEQSKSVALQWNRLKATVSVLAIQFGSKLLPAISDTLKMLSNPKLTASEKFDKLMEKIGEAISAAIPKIAEAVGRTAPKVAIAFVKGFLAADALGKLAIGGWLFSKLGGFRAISSAGGQTGTVFGRSFAAKAALAGLVATSLISGVQGAAKPARNAAAHIRNALSGLTFGLVPEDAGGMGAVIAQGIAEKVASKFGPAVDRAFRRKKLGKLQDLEQQLAGLISAAAKSGAEDADLEPLRDRLRSLRARIEVQVETPRAGAQSALDLLESGLLARMRDIKAKTAEALRDIDAGWKHGTQPWRNHVADAMDASVQAIRVGMHKGLISTAKGQQQIAGLLRNKALVTGADPFKIAKGFADSWGKASLTNDRNIERVTKALGKMPPAARGKAQDAMIAMAQAMERKGQLVKGSADRLRSALVAKFGNTAEASVTAFARGMSGLAGVFDGLRTGIGRALDKIGIDVGRVLKSLGGSFSPIHLGVSKHTGDFLSDLVHGKPFGKARGGMLGGSGRRDTVPIMAAPGEAILNRHQQPHVEQALAVSKAMGVGRYGSLGEVFAGESTPHYMAKGGKVPYRLSGPAPLVSAGNAAIGKTWAAAKDYVKEHRPRTAGAGVYHGPLNRIFPHPGGPQISFNAAAYLAEKAGLPGVTYAQIAIGESGLRPGAVSSDGGYGLWQMTPRVQSAETVARWNALGSYFNPWTNAQMAKVLAGSGTGTSNYFGTGSVTNWNKHYHGPKPQGAARGGFVGKVIQRLARGGHVGPAPQGQRGPLRRAPGDQVTAARRATPWHSTEPRTLNRLFAVANKVNRAHFPYVLGGGHSGTPAPFGPFDCSGAVSYLVQQSGWSKPTTVSGGMTGWFHGGKGKDFSILANAEHVYAVIGGKAWGTSESNPDGGAGWISGYTYRPGFSVRHPALGTGGGEARDAGPSKAELKKREQRRRANHRISERFSKLQGLRRVGLGGAGLDKALALARFWHYFRDVKGADEKRWAGLEKRLDIARTPAAKRMVLGQLRRTQHGWGEEEISGHTIEALRKAHGPMPGYDTPADRTRLIRERTAQLGKLKFTLANAVTDKGRVKALDDLSDFWAKYGVFGPQPKRVGTEDMGLASKGYDWRPLAEHLRKAAYANLKPKRHLEAEREWVTFANKRGRIGGMPEAEAKRRLPHLAKTKVDASERIANLKELLRLSNLRLAVSEAQGKVLAEYPAIEGALAKGGWAQKAGTYLVGERGPELAELPAGTRVRSNAETRTLAAPDVRVIVHGDVVSDRRNPIEVRVDDRQVEAVVEKAMRRTARRAGRPLPGRGGGRI